MQKNNWQNLTSIYDKDYQQSGNILQHNKGCNNKPAANTILNIEMLKAFSLRSEIR